MANDFDGLNNFPAEAPTPTAAAGNAPRQNDFDGLDNFPTQQTSGTVGSFFRSAVGGAGPAAGAMRGGALGFELGVASPIPFGGFIGAGAGALLGGMIGAGAQNWALDALPGVRDALGQDEETKRRDQEQHPVASFLGGMMPFAVTMSPFAGEAMELPANATTWQRLLANPKTARVISGLTVGGMQIGQEAIEDHHVDWMHAAVATGFGLVFNRPNFIGERISSFGAKPMRYVLGLPQPVTGAPPANVGLDIFGPRIRELGFPPRPNYDIYGAEPEFERAPTRAEVETGTAGPGITEAVSQGQEGRNPAAYNAAMTAASTEKSILDPDKSGLWNVAKSREPELFEDFENAQRRLQMARDWINEFNVGSPVEREALVTERDALQAEHDALGYKATPTGRRLRANIRALQGQINILDERKAAFAAGTAVETADTAAARQQLIAAQNDLHALAPRVRLALEGAADYTGEPTIPPPAPLPEVEPAPIPQVEAAAPQPIETAPAVTPAAPAAVAPTPQAPPPRTSADLRAQIAADTEQRLIKAGEPPERAKLIGQIQAAIYAARASRFGGAIGNALEVYQREGPRFARATGEPPPPSGGAPAARTPEDILADPNSTRAEKAEALKRVTVQAAPAATTPAPAPRASLFTPAEVEVKRLVNEADAAATLEERNKEALQLADEAESYGEGGKGFAEGIRGAARAGTIRPDSMQFYRDKVADLKAQSGKSNEPVTETYGLTDLIKGDPVNLADYHKIMQLKQPPSVASALKYAANRFEDLIKGINAAGFKFTAIDSFNARDNPAVLEAKQRASEIGGAAVRLLKGLRSAQGDVSTGRVGQDLDSLDNVVDASEKALAALQRAEKPIEVKPKRPRGRAAADPKTLNLLEFIARQGGIRNDDPKISDVNAGDNIFVPGGFGPLVRKPGVKNQFGNAPMSLDQIWRMVSAEDVGYLAHDTDVNDLVHALNEREPLFQAGQGKTAKMREGEERKAREEHEAIGAELDQHLKDSGIDIQSVVPEIRARTIDLIRSGTHNVVEAFNAADREFEQQASQAGQVGPEFEGGSELAEPGHGFAEAVGGAAAGREQPRGTEVGNEPRGAGGIDREQTAEAIDQAVDEYFQSRGEPLGSISWSKIDGNIRALILRMDTADASTMIHELSHDWLEQLVRDAQHPQAPAELQHDAAAVLRQLGFKTPEAFYKRNKNGTFPAAVRKAHEQFAQWGEQYFRLGVTPTPELANVFARFKEWLLNLYKTVVGLGRPISADIRAVFDRMLTEADQPAIAAGPGGGPSIQDIHEADAKTIEPPEAEAEAHRVEAERDQYVKELPPQIQAELKGSEQRQAERQAEPGTQPAGEGGTVAGGRGEVERGGGGPGPVAPGGGGREEYGPVVEGGAAARPESAPIPRGGGADAEHPLATTPDPNRIPPPGGDQPDRDELKAWNIRVENVTNDQQVADQIMAGADRIGPAPQGDALPREMLWELASAAGRDPAGMDEYSLRQHLDAFLGGMRDMPKKVLAIRMMLKASATQVANLAKAVKANINDDAAVVQFALAVTKHDMIQSAIMGATASWGRTGHAFRDISQGWESFSGKTPNANALLMAKTGQTLFQMKQLALLMSEYDDINQISKFINDRGKPQYGRMTLEYWINGLISNPITHMTYAIGNTILGIEKVGLETPVAAALGAARRAMGREGETVKFGEVAAGFKAMRNAIAPAMQSAAEATGTGRTTLLPGESPTATLRFAAPISPMGGAVLNEAANFHDVMTTTFGIVKGIREGVKTAAALQAAGGVEGAPLIAWTPSPNGYIGNLQVRGVTMAPVGELARLPSRMMAGVHSFFRPINYMTDIAQRAYRDATERGFIGPARDAEIARLLSNPPPDWMRDAHNTSNELTMMGAGAAWTGKLTALISHEFLASVDPRTGRPIPGSGWPFLKFIDPFVRISANIIDQSIVQRTPLGILTRQVRDDLMGRNGNVRADMAAAKMLVGSALGILFGTLAAEGYVTGSEPADPEAAAVWRQVYQAHSVRIGDTWYAMNRLGPMGMLLSTAADLYQVAHLANQADLQNAVAALQHAISQNILDESFMRGPSDLLKAVDEPNRYGAAYVRNFVSSFVPYSVGMAQLARSVDPYTRQARTLTDAIVNKVPFLSEQLLPRRDVWGEPLPSRTGVAGATAVWEQRVNNDPVNIALLRHGIKFGMPERSIRNVPLNDQQYDDFSRLSGRLAKMRLDAIVRSPSYAGMSPGTQHDLIVEQLRQAREVARNMMFMKYPSLLSDAYAARMAKRSAVQ